MTDIFDDFLKSEKIYHPDDIIEVLNLAMQDEKPFKTRKKIAYYNVPCSFDIETSSFMQDTQKVAIMYEWTFGINGLVVIGRRWNEFFPMLEKIVDYLGLSTDTRLVVYVHNLAYEFQYIRKWLDWEKVFSISNRKPIYAVTTSGVEFRCSYLLSGYSLAKIGENLRTYHIKKMVGDLDYEKVRHSETPMTDAEIGYCVNDVKVVMAYIAEKITADGDISRIPMTKTGYVRNFCRKKCFYEEKRTRKKKSYKYLRYMETMKGLHLDVEEYKQLKRAFQGGFTHANPFYSGKVLENVSSDDFTSSYPAVMVAEQFPMSSSEHVQIASKADFERNLKYYCCLFDVEFIGLKPIIFYENYISLSRCWSVEKAVLNNGRVVSADHLFTTITEQDFLIIRKFYTWDHMRIGNFRRYRKGYLPKDFILAILKLYGDKTTLKGVDGKEVEYLSGKEMLNSTYGMTVCDIIRDEITYKNDEWCVEFPDYEKAIEDYNESRSRFLFYPWGVWVTAYARRNLFTGILAFGEDYVYSDTDSIKSLHRENHTDYIDKYNRIIQTQLENAMDYHGLPYDLIRPKTIKGVEKPLGVWDYEGTYDKFKTLGAKRYMVEKDGDINITVAGLNKKACVPYMLEKWGDKVFDNFSDNLYIPPEHTGKNTHTYIDDERRGIVTDYLGNSAEYWELSSVHLMQADYSLSLAREYVDYILNVQEDL